MAHIGNTQLTSDAVGRAKSGPGPGRESPLSPGFCVAPRLRWPASRPRRALNPDKMGLSKYTQNQGLVSKRGRDVRSWRPVWKRVVWAGGGLFGLLALSAWLQVQAVRLSYRSHALRQEIAALDRREIAARRRLDTALALHAAWTTAAERKAGSACPARNKSGSSRKFNPP
jgi:hypothetical protein